jgi:hypothetical protein
MKTKPFSELRNRMTPERRARNKIRTQLALIHLTLLEQRKLLGCTDEELEKDLNTFESAFSELDKPEDIQVSTLSRYIQALGGSLKLVANFPDQEIVLAQFD